MLPRFLAEIQARGYKVVHMRAKGTVEPLAEHIAKLTPVLAKAQKAAAGSPLVPFYGLVKPGAADEEITVTAIAPAARVRSETAAGKGPIARSAKVAVTKTAVRGWTARGGEPAPWGAVVVRDK